VVYGSEDKIDNDVDIDEDEDTVVRSDESVTPTNDILVREKEKSRIEKDYKLIF
jgi:hypothetical protein